jgi:predicted phage-related endonuclease
MNATKQISTIDELGSINEQIKALEARAKELKAEVANQFGEGAVAGAEFSAKVTLSQRNTLDGKALAAELGATAEQIAKFTKVSSIITIKTERITHVA